jgi:16S rRNA processing protein RimM
VRSSPGARAERVQIASCRRSKDGLLMRFDGDGDRNAAETLHGVVLEVSRDEVPPAEDGSWYWFELTGCRCIDETLGEIGTVVDVIEDGGGLLLDLASEGQRRLLVPFVRTFLVQVYVGAGRIDLRLPEGLVETCTSGS